MEVKGTAVEILPPFILKKFGKEGYEKWLKSISTEAYNVYFTTILTAKWYDLKTVFIEPTEKLLELFYNKDIIGAYELGVFSAEHALKGIYKIFLRFGSPEFVIKKANIILPTYYTPSAMEISSLTKGYAVLRVTQFPDMHPIVEQRIKGWMDKALEISGGKNSKIEITRSLTRNDPCTEYTVTWD